MAAGKARFSLSSRADTEMPLRGIKVLEFAGLAPGPFCGKILADFGASVTRIDKIYNSPLECLPHGKRTLVLNIKNPKSQEVVKNFCKHYDVLIEPFRPGVMEKCGLGPKELIKENEKLIYARLTGFGQSGTLNARAGHDINYLALSGVLSFLGRKDENPTAPVNLAADFAGGGLLCAMGILLALLDRYKTGKGQVVDSSMVEGAAYVASWLFASQRLPIWGAPRGENTLDTGAFFYDTYKTKDGKYMSVGAIEPQFYKEFVNHLGLEDISQFDDQELAKRKVADAFAQKTQEEWSKIFDEVDACVFPVVDWNAAPNHPHNRDRESFTKIGDQIIPTPSPKLSRTPGKVSAANLEHYEATVETLKEIGYTDERIKLMNSEGIITLPRMGKL